jgi:hypothetical protein
MALQQCGLFFLFTLLSRCSKKIKIFYEFVPVRHVLATESFGVYSKCLIGKKGKKLEKIGKKH